MGVDDAELFRLEAAVLTLLPSAVLQSIASNGSSDTATSALQGGSGPEKPSAEHGLIQLTAVAVTLQ
jgi:hypothetical protein